MAQDSPIHCTRAFGVSRAWRLDSGPTLQPCDQKWFSEASLLEFMTVAQALTVKKQRDENATD